MMTVSGTEGRNHVARFWRRFWRVALVPLWLVAFLIGVSAGFLLPLQLAFCFELSLDLLTASAEHEAITAPTLCRMLAAMIMLGYWVYVVFVLFRKNVELFSLKVLAIGFLAGTVILVGVFCLGGQLDTGQHLVQQRDP